MSVLPWMVVHTNNMWNHQLMMVEVGLGYAVSMLGCTVSMCGGNEAGSQPVVSKLSVLVLPMGGGRGEAKRRTEPWIGKAHLSDRSVVNLLPFLCGQGDRWPQGSEKKVGRARDMGSLLVLGEVARKSMYPG